MRCFGNESGSVIYFTSKLKPIYETDLTTCGFTQFGLSEYVYLELNTMAAKLCWETQYYEGHSVSNGNL